ncbi:hypothetical protein EDB84DRAFT_515778 [Lactarius hengduanensis]|nr:hypothetical protein EDB84DRAFT_515778 [Lactarius hengduanensis]
MSSTLSYLSSTEAATVPTTTSTPPLFPSGTLPPFFVVFICAGVLATSSLSIYVCRRLVSREAFQSISVYTLLARGRKYDSDPANGRPEMFDARIGQYTTNSLKWEEYMPFSVTVMTNSEANGASGPVREVGKLLSDSARERRGRQKQDQESCRLQVGVLVAMPSQPHTRTHNGVGQKLSESPLRDGLAIGLIEMPWIEEDRQSTKMAS